MPYPIAFLTLFTLWRAYCWSEKKKTSSGNQMSSGNKTIPVPLHPPQIPYDITRGLNRGTGVGNQRATAWAMAQALNLYILKQQQQQQQQHFSFLVEH
jgi:hypothetical protein